MLNKVLRITLVWLNKSWKIGLFSGIGWTIFFFEIIKHNDIHLTNQKTI